MAMELDAVGTNPAAGAQSDNQQVTLVAEATATPAAIGTPTTTTIALEAGNIVHLPVGTDISHPVQVGNDLEFIQPDGSIILIPNGAVAGLVVFIGTVEIPADTVAALFSANNIQPAEGPGGDQQHAHGNFTHDPGPIGTSFGLTDLLGPNELHFAPNELPELFAQLGQPRFTDKSGADIDTFAMLRLSDEGLPSDGNPTGNTDPYGALDQSDNALQNGTFFVTDPAGDPLTFALGQPVATFDGVPGVLTSGGQPIVWFGVGTDTLSGRVGATEIIHIVITDGGFNDGLGKYTVELKGPVDHHNDSRVDPNDPTKQADEDDLVLSFNVKVSDAHGGSDSATFVLGIEDDSPELKGPPPAVQSVDEDDLTGLSVGTDQTKESTSVSGDLHSLVLFGGDGEKATGGFTFSGDYSALDALGLHSKGDEIDYSTLGNTLSGIANGRTVFTLELHADGKYTFTLYDQLDHVPPGSGADENTNLQTAGATSIDFGQVIQAYDNDGDFIALGGQLKIAVVDDVPVTIGTETGTADEDDLADFNPLYPLVFDFWQGSLGTSPFDGPVPDGSITGLLGTVPVWGFLDDNVRGGADEFGKFSLLSESDADALLATFNGGQPLKSHGDEINHTESITIPGLGDAMGFFAADGRLVFGLFVDEHLGVFNFRLFDQLDHPLTDNPKTDAVETAFEDTLTLNVGKFITYTDRDGDTVNFHNVLNINVVDDIPQLHGAVKVTLDEDDLSNFNPLLAGALHLFPSIFEALPSIVSVVGSDGTDQNPSGLLDSILGTTSKSGFLDEIIGTNVVIGGADEFGRFALIDDASASVLLKALNLKSDGSLITHAEHIDVPLLGTIMGFFAEDGRLIMTLTVGELGNYDVRLFDQIDHPLTDDPSTGSIETAFQDTLTIDLGHFVTYTDYDGDKIDLGTGHLVLDIVDDIPQITTAQVVATVEEEDGTLSLGSLLTQLGINIPGLLDDMGHGNEDTTSNTSPNLDTDTLGDMDARANYATGSLASLITVGADEEGAFSFAAGLKGAAVHNSNGGAVTSRGQSVLFDVTTLGGIPVLVGYVENVGGNSSGFAAGDRLVFSLTLSDINPLDLASYNPTDGYTNNLFTFIQHDQLDEPAPANGATEDLITLDLSKTVVFTDADGDKVGLGDNSFLIQSIDDTPIQVVGQTIHKTVEEEHNVTGPNPPVEMTHGNEDTTGGVSPDLDTDTNTSGSNASKTNNTASGDLRNLFKVGADEVTTDITKLFPLETRAAGRFTLEVGTPDPLYSKAQLVAYQVTHAGNKDTLTAFVDSDNSGTLNGSERTVFTLEVTNTTTNPFIPSAGDYKFTLLDQIDHPDGQGENVKQLDLSTFVRFSDFDGDRIGLTQGTFTVGVIDDVPILASGNPVVSGQVDEDELSTASSLPGPDQTNGNTDGDSVIDEFAFTQTALRALVKSGADEDVTFNLAPSQIGGTLPSGNVTLINGTPVTSHGANVKWGVDGSTVIGFVDSDSSGGYTVGDRVVFQLTQTGNGSITFDLQDAIDHPLHTDDNETLTLNITPAFVAHDFDMDYVALASNSVQIVIEDDTPINGVVYLNSGTIIHDETPGQNSATDVASTPALAALFTGVNGGSDPDVAHVDGGAIGYAQAGTFVASTSVSYGADKQGAPVAFSLSLSAQSVDSGLLTTEGLKIFLWKDSSGRILGLVDNDGVAGVTGGEPAAFALNVDGSTGAITIAQYLSIHHDDPADPDEPTAGAHTLEAIKAGVLSVTATFTDGDLDTTTASADIGAKIIFEDDGPSLTATGPSFISNGLFIDGFLDNSNIWGTGSGTAREATPENAGDWVIGDAGLGGGVVQLERVGDGYLGMHSSTSGFMVDMDASPHNVSITHDLTLLNGEKYDIVFEAGAPPQAPAGSAHLKVFFNGNEIADIDTAGPLKTYSFNVTAGPGPNNVEFREVGTSADNHGTYLANIKITDVIIIDETKGIDADSDEVPGGLANLFTGVPGGTDPDMPEVQYAQGSSAIVNATPIYGADGPAAGGGLNYAFTLAAAQVDSGLETTEHQTIYLTKDGSGRIVGLYDSDGNTSLDSAAFALAVNSNGIVSVAQYVSLSHPDTTSHDEGIYLDPHTLSVTVSATDGDGDKASQTLDVSGAVRFEDDGPSVTFGTPSGDVLAGLKVELDETLGADRYNLAIGETEDAGGNANTDDGTGLGRVTTAIGGAGGLLSLFPATIVYGADGPGVAPVGTLSFTGIVPASGIATNLSATHGGAITLFLEGNDLVGRDTDSEAVFRIAIVQNPTGTYQLQTTLYEALNHGLDGNLYDHEIGLLLQSGSIGLKYDVTVTDGDGDTASNSAVLPLIGTQSSYFSFDDDGPQLTAVTHIGSNLIVNGSFEDGHGLGLGTWDTFFSVPGWSVPDAGAPGLGDDAPFEIQTGAPGGDLFYAESGDAKLELDSDAVGTGNDDNPSNKTNSTVQQLVAGTSEGETYELSFWYAPRPNDGNADSSSFKVYWNGVEVLNVDSTTASPAWTEYKITVPGTAGPAALAFQATGQENSLGAYIDNVSLFQVPTVHVDEDGLLAGNHDAAAGDDVVPNEFAGFDNNEATNYGVLGINWGSDSYDDAADTVVGVPASGTAGAYLTAKQDTPSGLGDRSVTFTSNSVLVGGVASLTSQGQPVTFVVEDNGTKIVGYADFGGNAPRAVIEVALADEDSGYFRVALLDKIDHPVSGSEDNITLTFGYTATDADGDTVKGSFAVSVDDDLPVTQAAAQNLIVNGDFTEGNWSDPAWWGSIAPAGGVPGWTIIGDPSDPPSGIQFERQLDGFEGLNSSTHHGMIDLGASPGNYQLSQVVSAAVDQQTYAIEFEIGAPFPGTALLQVYWGGQLIAIIDTTKDEGALDKYSYIVKGGPNDAANTLTFREIGEGHAPLPGEDQDEGYHGTYVANVKMFAVDAVVDEDGLNNANAVGVGNSDSIGDDPATAASASGLLGIKWGADDHDINDVGSQDALVAGNRNVTFADASIVVGGAASLTSAGHNVATALVDNGTRLVGFIDSGAGGYDVGDHVVFDVKLSDDLTGSFLFTLYDKLDHAPGGSENDLTLKFAYTATDSDGDKASGSFIVGVDDDSPKAIADADSVTGGSATGNVVTAAYTAAGTLGAADGNSANGTADNPGADGFKSIAWVGADNTGVIHGTRGDLHVDALGNYRYVPDHSGIAVQSLVIGPLTDVFTYTISDGDGDVSSAATLTITLSGPSFSSAITDPIVLDLDGDGVHLNAAASFDLNHDGQVDKIAWPGPHDGLLVADLDHSGTIDDGKEVFSPSFGEGGHKDSLAALATYDSNGDGRITADDAHFADIGVWTDANGDGVSDTGELHSLGDLGVVGIDLGAEEVDFDLDGQHVFAQGTFELANGETHQFLGVDLGPQDPLAVPPDITGAVHTGTDGADNFALTSLNAVDLIADYDFAQGDTVDLSALLGDNSGATKDNAGDYVKYDGNTGTVSVDTDGAANGSTFVDVAVIDHPVADVKIILDDGVDVTVNHIG